METLETRKDINSNEQILSSRVLILKQIIEKHFKNDDTKISISPIDLNSNLGQLSQKYRLTLEEELLIIFAYSWEFLPELFLPFVEGFKKVNFRTNFGGFLEKEREIFIPTLKTFLMICIPKKDRNAFLLKVASPTFPLIKDGIIELSHYSKNNDNLLDQKLKVANNYIEYLIGGESPRLDHEIDFPARLTTSKMSFEKVILPNETKKELESLELLLKVRPLLKEKKELYSYIKSNQLFVFTGSPGTGKSLTATTLGQDYNVPTYTLDISRVVSRYVGDFEKAMERIFTRLEGHNCILFIDEADSIFTKRNENVNEAKDKYSNQEMSYLLQRLETFDGIVILASNVTDIRTHVDKAMLRRINHIIEFPFPLAKERYLLWATALPKGYIYKEGLLEELSQNYQLSGANISSIISEVLIKLIHDNHKEITFEIVEPYLKKEFYKRDSTYRVCPDTAPGAALIEQRLGRTAVHTGRRM
ncbi:ATP-binding protein [Flammeovirga kamogawensis]|uniref:ATP-binding protein n=1 Tax=Flammeovirga kamogawensis TaxID=373891 RepID=A0ABX8GYF2_9BACT|nr:ATP-binding protein [Flammeovirga kamogawensis]MBB6458852.1 ATP-dependent 26S proteasome regulatory subunit [Flammeovirga kamogawensis]QWG08433.1 ATP-binding protein [Flammeovirga kamogawensis]TRX66730.1 AAA family ATPase [Flammeovirga kamogawensis]